MTNSPKSAASGFPTLALQLVAVVGMVAALALVPPAQGRMLLVPVLPGAEQGMVARATSAGALLLARGPLPHSMIVTGDRTRVSHDMLAHGVLVLAAPAGECGAKV